MSTAPARTNHSPQQDLHIGIDCQRPSYVNSNGHRCRSLKKIHEPELQTKSPQCADKSEMTAAELFLENFLRNTGDNLQLDRKKEEEIAHTSVVISEKAHDSSAYSPDPYYQGDRDNILEHDRSSLQITPNKPRKHNLPIEPPASRSNQHDRRSMPRCARSKCPISQNMFRLPETALHKISYLRNSPTASCHTSKRSHDIDDYKTLRQQSAYLKEKYSEPLYLKESNKYYDTKYTLPSPASPPRPPPPQPLPSSYYSLKSYKSYRGTEWSHIPPLVYPAPPLPSTIPSGGCYVAQYEFDYRGPTTSRDPLIPPQSTTTQYRPYPPLRSPVREAAYRGRLRSPVVSNRCSYKEMAPSYETEPVSLHRDHVTSEHDQYKTSCGWNKDRDYHQSYATPSVPGWPQVKSFEGTERKMVDRSYGKGESCGRGGRGRRGIIKVEDIDDMRGADKSIKSSFDRY